MLSLGDIPLFENIDYNIALRHILGMLWVKVIICMLFTYLSGAYRMFLVLLPVHILLVIYFTVIVIFYNEKMFTTVSTNIMIITPAKRKIILLVIWLVHIITMVLFIVWYDRLRGDTYYLFIRQNMLSIAMISIIIFGVLLVMSNMVIYDTNIDESYFVFASPVLLLGISALLYC